VKSNLATTALSKQLAENVCGVYIGWAGLANHGVYKMVMNIGWSPYFDNAEKTVEPWLLHDFAEDFYGVELRLVVVGYIRPEVGVPIIAQRNRLVYQTPHPSCYWESLPRCIIHFPR
jgi:FAD synthase